MKDMGWQQEVLTTEPVKRRQISEPAQHILAVLDVPPAPVKILFLPGRAAVWILYYHRYIRNYRLELAGLAKEVVSS